LKRYKSSDKTNKLDHSGNASLLDELIENISLSWLLWVAFTGSNAGCLGKRFLFRFSFLEFVSIRTFRSGMLGSTLHTEKIGRIFTSVFVKPVFAILFFKVGIRTGRVWRGIVVIKIRFVNDLINIIQNHVGMNYIKQVFSIYVQQIKSTLFTQDYF
jgi:hypothetical protein